MIDLIGEAGFAVDDVVSTLVFAGSYREFQNYCREENINPYNRAERVFYVSSPEQTYGLRNFKIVKYGTWFKNKWLTPVLLARLEFQMSL